MPLLKYEPIYMEVLPPDAKAGVLKYWNKYRRAKAKWENEITKESVKTQWDWTKITCEKSFLIWINQVHIDTAKRLKLQFVRHTDDDGNECEPYPGLQGMLAALFQWMIEDHKQVALMLSRDHTKTLFFGCWGPEWLALHPHKLRAPEWSYITASGKLAAKKGKLVRKDLEFHPKILQMWGCQRRPGSTWNEDVIETASGFTLNFVGAGEQTRGPHPAGATIDDTDSSETARSDTMTTNIKEWMWADFYGQLEPGDPLGVIGTNNGRGTMLDEIYFDPILQKAKPGFCAIKIRGCDLEKAAKLEDYKITRPIWSKKFGVEELKAKLLTMGDWAYDREIQNEPHGVDEPIFRMEWVRANEVQPWEVPAPNEVDPIIAYDPAWRATELSDFTGWCEVWVSKRKKDKGFIYVWDWDQRKYTTDDFAQHIVNRHVLPPFVLGHGVEVDANQKYLHDYLLQKMAIVGVAPNILPIESEGKDKAARAEAVQGLVQSGRVKFIAGKYPGAIDQMIHFCPRRRSNAHDDMVDAFVYALKVVQKWYFLQPPGDAPQEIPQTVAEMRTAQIQDKFRAKLTGKGGPKHICPITGQPLRRSA